MSFTKISIMNRIAYVLLLGLVVGFSIACRKTITTHVAPKAMLYYCSRQLTTGAWQVYIKDFEQNTTTEITNNTGYNYWWVEPSPNHTKLLMLRSPYNSSPDQFNYNNCEMIVANIDGTNQQVIVADNANGWFAFGNPHWHPNGNRILMIAQPNNTNSPFYLATINVDGSNPTLITNQFAIDGNWSPSGNSIVYIGIGALGVVPLNFEVFKADYNYNTNSINNSQQLTNDTTRNQDPCFSPNGLQISFSASNASLTNADIVVINSDGTNRTTLVNDNGIHGGPINWATDGKIYYHSIYIGSTNFIINASNTVNRSNETLLSSSSYDYISPYYTLK